MAGADRVNDLFNVRWNNYTSVIQNVFQKLLDTEKFVDVTLACEGKSLKCHRVILSACSSYFEQLFTDNPNPNLVVYMKDMKFWEMQALVSFMYNGEVSVSHNDLQYLVKAAESLKIKGLASNNSTKMNSQEPQDEDEPPKKRLATGDKLSSKPNGNSPHGLKRKVPNLFKVQNSQGLKSATITLPVSNVKQENDLLEIEEMHHLDDVNDQMSSDINYVEMDEQQEDESNSDPEFEIEPHKILPISHQGQYDSSIKESALACINSGMSLRQCSVCFGIPRKTLSKWRKLALETAAAAARKNKKVTDNATEGEDEKSPEAPTAEASPNTGNIRSFGSQDPQNRAKLLQQAMELSLEGVTVRQAAAHFGIPRTTLCAFMKKRGVKAPTSRTLPKPPPSGISIVSVSNDKNKIESSDSIDEYPYMGLSHFMDDMSGVENSEMSNENDIDNNE